MNIRLTIAVLSAVCWSVSSAKAGILTGDADLVLGQTTFETSGVNRVDGRSLNFPYGVAFDTSTGRVYVVDTNNHRVLWWDNADSISNGAPADGVIGQADFHGNLPNRGIAAEVTPESLYDPACLAVDSSGNLWVTDSSNHRVLMYEAPVSIGHAASLVIGQTDFISRTSLITAAGLKSPEGLAFDGSGNLWVVDTGNSRALRFDAQFENGMEATLVIGQENFESGQINRDGGLNPSALTLSNPSGAAIDAAGNLWLTDTLNHRALMYEIPHSSGMAATRVLGQSNFTNRYPNGDTGQTSANTLDRPKGILVDAQGNIWVADYWSNQRVLKYEAPIDSNGKNANIVLGQEDFTSKARTPLNNFERPQGLALDASGNIWVSDEWNHRVVKYELPHSSGMPASLVLGQPALEHRGMNYVDGRSLSGPHQIAFCGVTGRMYAADRANSRVLWWDSPGQLGNTEPASGVIGQADLYSSYGNRGRAVNAPAGPSTLKEPEGVGVDSEGHLWVSDTLNNRVLKYSHPVTSDQEASLVLGQEDFTSNSSGTSATTLISPSGLHICEEGKLWVVDRLNHRVLWWDDIASLTNGQAADGVLGQQDLVSGDYNSGGVSARTLSYPRSVFIGSGGNVWVADSGPRISDVATPSGRRNNRVLRYDAPIMSGMDASIVLGREDFTTESDPVSHAPKDRVLMRPQSIEEDVYGNLWVATGSRLLMFEVPISSYMAASFVIGQAGFDAQDTKPNRGFGFQPRSDTLYAAKALAFDDHGNLWVSDTASPITADYRKGNHRILRFNSTVQSGIVEADIDNYSETVINFEPEWGVAEIRVPAGSFGVPVSVSVSTAAVPPADRAGIKVSGVGLRILLNKNIQPSREIAITFNYRDSDVVGLDKAKLVIGRYDPINSRWVPLRSVSYPSLNRVTGSTMHLSTFALIHLDPSGDLDESAVFPVPFNPVTHSGGLVFENLTEEAEISIFTLNGELVREVEYIDGTGRAVWDGKNRDGKAASRGVYFALIKSGSDTKILRIAVEK